jgi:hypothetical protein
MAKAKKMYAAQLSCGHPFYYQYGDDPRPGDEVFCIRCNGRSWVT